MQRVQQRWHGRIWLVLGAALPLVFLVLMALRQTTPLERPAVLIEVPEEVAQSNTAVPADVTRDGEGAQ